MMRGVDASTWSASIVGAGAVLTAVGGLVAQVRADVRRAEREHGVTLELLERLYVEPTQVVAYARRDLENVHRNSTRSRHRTTNSTNSSGVSSAVSAGTAAPLGRARDVVRAMLRQAVDDVIGWDADAHSAQQYREDVVEVGELER